MTFLITLAPVMLCTILALVRVRRFGKVAFVPAVVVGELPQLVALYLLLATTLALSEGDLTGTAGLVVLVLVVATLLGHLVLAVRGTSARASVRRGLADVGPVTGASQIEQIPFARGGVRPWLRRLVMPLPLRPWGVQRVRGLAYGTHRRQRLDVYRSRRVGDARGVLVYLHGGGYFTGSRHWEARALLHHFAARGWVCVSASYRLRPEAGFDEHLADARAAVAWAHEHAVEYGGDPSTLVMAGSSAGAHLTSIAALTQGDQPDPETRRIDAAVCLYGYYERYYGRGADEPVASSPLYLDATDAPPFFLAHGDLDSYVPVEQARDLVRHLNDQSSQPVAYAELHGATHGFDLFDSWRFGAVVDGIETFVDTLERPGASSEEAVRRVAPGCV